MSYQSKDSHFFERLRDSAQDFLLGVKPDLQDKLQIKVYPVDDMQNNELAKKFDQVGIDSFYFDADGEMRGLASRVNYFKRLNEDMPRPTFSLRFRKWDAIRKRWEDNAEFSRKLRAANSPESFSLFPKLHVESFCHAKRSGNIGRSFGAETKDIVNFIDEYFNDQDRVWTYFPKSGERREVVCVDVEQFARIYDLIPVKVPDGRYDFVVT
ncbi:MAG: hypothetical protein U0136_22005 [Bdellovibrionota bacterium]